LHLEDGCLAREESSPARTGTQHALAARAAATFRDAIPAESSQGALS